MKLPIYENKKKKKESNDFFFFFLKLSVPVSNNPNIDF
jgi:hypothetical protein